LRTVALRDSYGKITPRFGKRKMLALRCVLLEIGLNWHYKDVLQLDWQRAGRVKNINPYDSKAAALKCSFLLQTSHLS